MLLLSDQISELGHVRYGWVPRNDNRRQPCRVLLSPSLSFLGAAPMRCSSWSLVVANNHRRFQHKVIRCL